MKQILFVGAGNHFPDGPLNFMLSMHLDEHIHVRGLFFKPVNYAALAATLAPADALDESGLKEVANHKSEFARHCEAHHIRYENLDNTREWDKDLLIKESRFSDLMLISGELFYADAERGQPNTYLRDALRAAECPVVIVPEGFSKVEHVYMAYDGSRESVYAIKQYSQLLPQFAELPTELIYIRNEKSDAIPDKPHIRNLVQLKFESLGFSKLHFKPSEFFSNWISDKKNVLLVSGSFGRSGLSYMTKRSFAGEVIHDHTVPVFIAHH